MTKKQKKMLVRIFISAVLFLAVVLMPLNGIERIAAFIVPYLVIGWDETLPMGRFLMKTF